MDTFYETKWPKMLTTLLVTKLRLRSQSQDSGHELKWFFAKKAGL